MLMQYEVPRSFDSKMANHLRRLALDACRHLFAARFADVIPKVGGKEGKQKSLPLESVKART